MTNWYRFSCLAPCAVVVTGLLAAVPAAADVVLSFTGTVTQVGAVLVTPPTGVGPGSEVSGTVNYNPAEATVVEVGPGERAYIFLPGTGNQITMVIGNLEWRTDLQSIDLCDDVCGGDFVDVVGVSSTTEDFPDNVGSGILSLGFTDDADPFDLITGTDLPNKTEDVNFGAATLKNGSISSSDGFQSFWAIAFDVDSSTVPATRLTWSQVKTLYARP